MTKEQVEKLISRQDKDEEFYQAEYPNHQEALLSFLDEHDIKIKEEDLNERIGVPYIDSDDYPGVDSLITIVPFDLTLLITAFHHQRWDFYFNPIE